MDSDDFSLPLDIATQRLPAQSNKSATMTSNSKRCRYWSTLASVALVAAVLLLWLPGPFHTWSASLGPTRKSKQIDRSQGPNEPDTADPVLFDKKESASNDDGGNVDDDNNNQDDDNQGDDDESTFDTPTPTPEPTMAVESSQSLTTFCVIGDVPYSSEEAVELAEQLSNLSSDCRSCRRLARCRRITHLQTIRISSCLESLSAIPGACFCFAWR